MVDRIRNVKPDCDDCSNGSLISRPSSTATFAVPRSPPRHAIVLRCARAAISRSAHSSAIETDCLPDGRRPGSSTVGPRASRTSNRRVTLKGARSEFGQVLRRSSSLAPGSAADGPSRRGHSTLRSCSIEAAAYPSTSTATPLAMSSCTATRSNSSTTANASPSAEIRLKHEPCSPRLPAPGLSNPSAAKPAHMASSAIPADPCASSAIESAPRGAAG